jgi:hypothetical protein
VFNEKPLDGVSLETLNQYLPLPPRNDIVVGAFGEGEEQFVEVFLMELWFELEDVVEDVEVGDGSRETPFT